MKQKSIDTGQSFYALWWVARTSSIGCIVLFLSNLTLAAIIWSLFPLKEIRPMLFSTTEKANQVVRIEPMEKGSQGFLLMMESLARQYVELRETFDFQSEPHRWKKVDGFSSTELSALFQQQMDPRESSSPCKQFKDRGITRSVNIISSVHLAPSAPDVWQVEWESIDQDPKTGLQTRGHWISTLTAACQTRAVNLEDQYLNPIGFTVIQYTVNTKHGTTKESL